MLPLSAYLAKRLKKQAEEKRERGLAARFKDGLLALGASLRAGHSAENAIEDAAEELVFLYGKEDFVTREFEQIAVRIKMNVPLEQAITEFSVRIGLADARSFAEVFRAARRTGGEIGTVILETVQVIAGRLEAVSYTHLDVYKRQGQTGRLYYAYRQGKAGVQASRRIP